jgi:hypothetical protein
LEKFSTYRESGDVQNRLGIPKQNYSSEDNIEIEAENLEFKYDIDKFIEDEKKSLLDIKWLVAWEAGEKWKSQYILYSCLPDKHVHLRQFQGQTHLLTIDNEEGPKVCVILLKDLRDFIQDPEGESVKQLKEYSG